MKSYSVLQDSGSALVAVADPGAAEGSPFVLLCDREPRPGPKVGRIESPTTPDVVETDASHLPRQLDLAQITGAA